MLPEPFIENYQEWSEYNCADIIFVIYPYSLMYQPGLHIIATITTTNTILLENVGNMQQLVNELIAGNHLVKLGEVYHNFDPAGFTCVVCLSESHLSVHTWPEFNKVNLDIYLSNHLRNNDGTVEKLFNAFVHYFEGEVTDVKRINR